MLFFKSLLCFNLAPRYTAGVFLSGKNSLVFKSVNRPLAKEVYNFLLALRIIRYLYNRQFENISILQATNQSELVMG